MEGVGPERLVAKRPVPKDVLAPRRDVEPRTREQARRWRPGDLVCRGGEAGVIGAGNEECGQGWTECRNAPDDLPEGTRHRRSMMYVRLFYSEWFAAPSTTLATLHPTTG